MKFITFLFLCFLSLACFGADGYLARTNGNIVIGPGGSGGGAAPTFDANQFSSASGGTNIRSAALVTNLVNSGTIALTESASAFATDASLGTVFRGTLTGNDTLSNPTNPRDGQKVTWELIQDGTGLRLLTMDTKFAFGTDITGITLSTIANKRDFITAQYNSTEDKWYVVGFVRGY